MNKNLIIVLAGGFLIAVLVAFIVQASLSGGDEKEMAVTNDAPRVNILVASVNMAMGDELTSENIKWQQWPENAVFTGAIVQEDNKKPADMVSGRLVRPVSAGEPITNSALVDPSANFVAASLGEGMRAVALNVSAVQMAGGFIGPGDYVDIVLTYRETISQNGPEETWINDYLEMNLDRMATETILQNVKVLAVDQTAKKDEKTSGPKVGKTVTVEVDPAAAEVLVLAQSMGDLSLSLRGLGDDTHHVRKHPIVTDARVTGIYDEIYQELNKLRKTTGQNSNIVRIYNGYELSETPVRQ